MPLSSISCGLGCGEYPGSIMPAGLGGQTDVFHIAIQHHQLPHSCILENSAASCQLAFWRGSRAGRFVWRKLSVALGTTAREGSTCWPYRGIQPKSTGLGKAGRCTSNRLLLLLVVLSGRWREMCGNQQLWGRGELSTTGASYPAWRGMWHH